jgi:RNA polymerase sigma factor (sigma-70 family)
MTAIPLDTLVRAAAGGDRDAFASIVDRTRTLVCSIAMAILRDVEASQDVAQDVFLSAWRDLRKLREPSSFLPWLRQMTRNRAHHVLRSRVRERRVLSDGDADVLLEVATDGNTPAADLIRREDRVRLATAIEALPDDAREVVTLFYREGRSVRQVADLLDMREDAVKQRLARARSRLREAMLEQIGETLRVTAPGAAFTMAVMAATVAMPSTAAAAGMGLTAKVIGPGLIAKLAGAVAGASAGFIFGGTAVMFGMRQLTKQARDDEERRQLRRFGVTVMSTVMLAGSGFALFPLLTHYQWPIVLNYFAFTVALFIDYFIWLPKIVARRLALERLEDPVGAARRHRRDQIRCWVGYLAGAVSGGAATIYSVLR